MDLTKLTRHQIAELRLKCVEIFVATASKYALDKSIIFDLAQQTWEFIEKGPDSEVQKNPEAIPQKQEERQKRKYTRRT